LQHSQIETIQIEIELAFVGCREGLAVAGQRQRGTVDVGRKDGLTNTSAW